jgi:hypothetical protein
MNAADRFACLPSLLDGDHDLKRRWVRNILPHWQAYHCR